MGYAMWVGRLHGITAGGRTSVTLAISVSFVIPLRWRNGYFAAKEV